MALTLIRGGSKVLVTASGDSRFGVDPSTPIPKGWSVWGSDGRVVPEPGLYRVTTTGAGIQKRDSAGFKAVQQGALVRIQQGEQIVFDWTAGDKVALVEKIAPPPA